MLNLKKMILIGALTNNICAPESTIEQRLLIAQLQDNLSGLESQIANLRKDSDECLQRGEQAREKLEYDDPAKAAAQKAEVEANNAKAIKFFAQLPSTQP